MTSSAGLVIDADGHVEEDLENIVARMPDALRPYGLKLLSHEHGHVTYSVDNRLWRSKYPYPGGLTNHTRAGGEYQTGGRDPKVRLAVLDSEGIDAAVLYPSVGQMFGLVQTPSVAAAMCAGYNDWLAEYCSVDPRRLAGVALLPQQDPRLAARELERAVTEHGFVGGVMRPNRVNGRTVDDPGFDVLWSKAAELDVPVALHEAYLSGIDTVGVDRMSSYAGCHVVSHVFEQMTAMLVVALAGVLERHPALRLGYFEAGCSWAPSWVYRIEEHFELAPEDFRGGDPTGTINRRTWLTFEVEEPMLAETCANGWGDNVCFASDFPHHDAVFPGAVKHVRDRQLPADLEQRLLSGNALRFYGARLARLTGSDTAEG